MLQPIVADALEAAKDGMYTAEPWSTFWSEQEARRLAAAAVTHFLRRFTGGEPIYPHVLARMIDKTMETHNGAAGSETAQQLVVHNQTP